MLTYASCLITDGSSYAFTCLNLEEKENPIQDLGDLLRPYEHIQNLNLSKNEIEDISSITAFNYLLVLDASTNHINSISFLENSPNNLQFLQVSNLKYFQLICN